jgi:hypothetical protein
LSQRYVKSGDTVTFEVSFTDSNYNTSSLTANDITVKVEGTTVTPSTKIVEGPTTITNGQKYKVTLGGITGNGALEITIGGEKASDTAGNTSAEKKQMMRNGENGVVVDNTKPTGSVTYSPVTGTRTSGSVAVTLTLSETITGMPSDRTSEGSNTYTKTYTVSGGETVNFSDMAGNTGSAIVNVPNIDKTAPTCGTTWSYEPT